jgi:peroxiredoxin
MRRFLGLAVVSLLSFGLAISPAFGRDNFKNFSLKTVDGAKKSLKDFQGKAVLVTFFFPTCHYCNDEFPHLQQIYDRYRGQGLTAVAINILEEENSQVAGWQQEHGYTIPVLIGMRLDKVQKDYDVEMTPTHFLLDSKGGVILKQSGYKPGDEKILEESVQKALGPAS